MLGRRRGGDIDNPRGIQLFDAILNHGLSVTKMPAPTRIGYKGQRDTYIDFFVTSDLTKICDVVVGPQISDHCFCYATLKLGYMRKIRRRVPNFTKTFLNNSVVLNNYFDDLDIPPLFVNLNLDTVCHRVFQCVRDGWERHGIFKYVNASSKPWVTNGVKYCRTVSRFWESKVRHMRRNNVSPIFTCGRSFSLDKCFHCGTKLWQLIELS